MVANSNPASPDGESPTAPLNVSVTGAGSPLVLIHGLFGMGSNLGGVARALADEYQVHQLDLPNHGRSPWVEHMDLAGLAAAVGGYIDAACGGRAAVLGHSLGGKVAMQLALDRPGAVAQLVLADIAPVTYGPSHGSVFAAIGAIGAEPPESRRAAGERMREILDEEAVVQFLLLSLARGEQGRYEWRFNAEGLRRCYEEILKAPREGEYAGPVLLVHGALSAYVVDEGRAAARARFPRVEFVSIADTGHWLHAEKPEAFNAAVREFLLRSRGDVPA